MSQIKSWSHTHFMGIGGIGTSALAQVLAATSVGQRLSGCDLHPSPITTKLERLGIIFCEGHSPQHLAGVDRLVISDAIKSDNPELAHARSLGLPVLRRSQVVGELMRAHRGIAVSGTHGKTTTTAMIGLILSRTGHDPTVLIGGELPQLGGNARSGSGEFLVAEACEAYESFLDLEPEIAVITNIEAEHLDHHHSEEALIASFSRFLERLRPGGTVVFCADDANAARVAARVSANVVSYGREGRSDYRALDVSDDGMRMMFTIAYPGGEVEAQLRVCGHHNVVNAVGAAAACAIAGVEVEQSAAVLADYAGVTRRFEVTTTAAGPTVVDDYAHHPTEIRAVIAAARSRCRGKLAVVFQPHLYSRTRDFLEGFADALSLADVVIVTGIYPAREEPLPGVSGESVVAAVRARGKKEAHFWPQKDEITARLAQMLKAEDWVLVLGAGDIGSVARDLVAIMDGTTLAGSGRGRSACKG